MLHQSLASRSYWVEDGNCKNSISDWMTLQLDRQTITSLPGVPGSRVACSLHCGQLLSCLLPRDDGRGQCDVPGGPLAESMIVQKRC
jgi:hypothetical protein